MSEILNYEKGLDLADNDKELYTELLKLYSTEAKFDVKELNDLIMKSEEEAASYVHRAKGACRQIGAELASEKGQQIEDILRKKAEGNLAPLINEFVKLLDDTMKAVNRELEKAGN
ncbi:MAG: Hpt domain-containing protein [Treponema sp.]|nr:Hpt domain-containing protein [Candidatus Treponema scatequi]